MPPRASRRAAQASCAALALLGAIATTGCVALDLMKTRESEEKQAAYALLSGSVSSADPAARWLVVFVAELPCDDDWNAVVEKARAGAVAADARKWSPELLALRDRLRAKATLVSHVVLQRPGRWFSRVAPGCYGVGAFVDANANYHYDADEPAAGVGSDPARLVELRAGQRRDGVDLVIPTGGRLGDVDPMSAQLGRIQVRSEAEQERHSLAETVVEGEIVDLDDPRFGPENGRLGYFDVMDFAWRVGPGIYFLEPHDPAKVPVLFVHGASGFPQNFTTLVARLDRTRFEPWLFFYPSGASLDTNAELLSQLVLRLRLRLGVDRLAVVAHSMGGLVARSFLLRHVAQSQGNPLPLFVSISSPWGGVASAAAGVESAPVVVPSWRDIDPNSPFLSGLFFADPGARTTRRPIPDGTTYHLVFGVDDTTISLDSAVRWEALRDATERWPLPYDHVEILHAAETSQLLGEMLERTFR